MVTLRDRADERDRVRFVGRASELAWFDRLLAGDLDHNVVHVTGAGGIGKSALLREVARRAGASGYRVVWIEGRDLPPFPTVAPSRWCSHWVRCQRRSRYHHSGIADVESDETFTLTLSNPVGLLIGDPSATGTIQNDDQPPPQPGDPLAIPTRASDWRR